MKEPKFRTIHPSIKYLLDKNAEHYKWLSSLSIFSLTTTFAFFAFLNTNHFTIHGRWLFVLGWVLVLISLIYSIFLVTHYSVMKPMLLIVPKSEHEKAKTTSSGYRAFDEYYHTIKMSIETLYGVLFTAGFLILLGTSIWNILCL